MSDAIEAPANGSPLPEAARTVPGWNVSEHGSVGLMGPRQIACLAAKNITAETDTVLRGLRFRLDDGMGGVLVAQRGSYRMGQRWACWRAGGSGLVSFHPTAADALKAALKWVAAGTRKVG